MALLSAGLLSALIAYLSLGPSAVLGQDASSDSTMDDRGCPIYTDYSMTPHGDRSSGPLGLPFMRPEERCRTFNSSAVEVSALISPIDIWAKDESRLMGVVESHFRHERAIEGSRPRSVVRKHLPLDFGYYRLLL